MSSNTEWLDKPDGDGWWWLVEAQRPSIIVTVTGSTFRSNKEDYIITEAVKPKWQRVAPHTPVPKPLPKERTVRAVVGWSMDMRCAFLKCGFEILASEAFDTDDALEDAIAHCRETWGLEPEVVE